jgi:tetratricopeptide (TPR) repeat protein
MERSKSFCVCLLVLLLAAPVRAAGAQERRPPTSLGDPSDGSIRCRVLLPSGAPAGRGIKVILNTTTSPLVTLFSDKNGEVAFKYLRAGPYTVDVEASQERYEPVSQKAVVFPSREAVVSVYLREKALKESKPSRAAVTAVEEFDAAVPPQAKKEYERAAKRARKGDILGAIRGFERAVAVYPDYQKARNDLGVQYFKAKRIQEAAVQFDLAIKLGPRAYNPRLNLGLLLVDTREYVRAIEELERAIAIDDSKPAAHLHLGIALTETGDLEAAKKEFRSALILGQDAYTVAYYRLGVAHARLGERDDAMRALTEYLQREPKGEFATAAKALSKELGGQ